MAHHTGHSDGASRRPSGSVAHATATISTTPRGPGSTRNSTGTPKAPTRAAIWKTDALLTGGRGSHPSSSRSSSGSQAVTP